MRKPRVFLALSIIAGLLLATSELHSAKPDKPRRATGIEKRTLWTSSKIQGTPDPPSPYQIRRAFPKLEFYEPLAMASVPGANRFLVAERPGKIFVLDYDSQSATKQLVVDLKQTLHGLTVHPNFSENGYFFVTAVREGKEDLPDVMRVVRLQAKGNDTPRADSKSLLKIIQWTGKGHRGGGLRFGPDGFLYIGVGDGSGIADARKTGQDVSDLLASVLRIDVDRPSQGRNYSIPADNPFVGQDGARAEIWSYGHRQPWRFSFDSETGQFWVADVGQDLWEMIYLVEKGGNYGWSVKEGNHLFRPMRKKGPSAILPPLAEHPHSEFRSITGGFVYHGKRLPKLRGAYIYGDYDTGKIWALWQENGKVTQQYELTDTQLRLVDFGQDRQGEIFLVDFAGGGIHELTPAPPQPKDAPQFPRKLSETGLFISTKDHQPHPGLVPYSVNAPLWSDGAIKDRWIALPGDSQIELDTVVYPKGAPGAPPGWRFPHDAVLVKTFSLEMEVGNPKSRRRLETRILQHKHMPGTDEYGAQFWRGYTYVWNEEQTDALLLESDGLNRTFTIKDSFAPSGKRDLVWRFPSRAECTLCHTMASKYALGPHTLQMNKDHDYGGVIANQISTLAHLGMFKNPPKMSPDEMPRLVDYRDHRQNLDKRARSYLHANCAHCHRKWGGGNAEFQLLSTQPLSETGTINTRPGQGLFDLKEPRILVPGEPQRSMIYYRMKKLGLGRMPHIASNLVDQDAVRLIGDWIKAMEKPEK